MTGNTNLDKDVVTYVAAGAASYRQGYKEGMKTCNRIVLLGVFIGAIGTIAVNAITTKRKRDRLIKEVGLSEDEVET